MSSSTSDPAPMKRAERATRRWRRLRARARIWRTRMHSHPVLLWTWRTLVVVVGGVLLLAGFTMWFTPGPGWASILLGLAVLATEFGWARRLLRRGQLFVRGLQNRAQEYRSTRKTKYRETTE